MILEVKNVKVKLGSSEILKDITFKVDKYEMVALLGPNGSGKSTILKTIFGVLRPINGVVYLDGENIEEFNFKEIARKIGYLPQENPETNLKVVDIVLLGRTPHISEFKSPSKGDLKIALNALKSVGLEGFEDRKFSELSGGEKQKVMIARIFAQQSEILLLDEPTAHLDISSQIEVMELVNKKVKSGVAAIIAIHDINLATSFCNRILMVKDGKIIRVGKPEEVINPSTIKEVFNTNVDVKKFGNRIYVVPKAKGVKRNNKNKKIHVICGGGSGVELIYKLNEMGYYVSAGVLNVLDSDWHAIMEVDGEVVDEAPFSPISQRSFQENVEVIEKSDLVILANLSVGVGNVLNLKAALRAAENGKLLVVDKTPFATRNFAGDETENLYRAILAKARVFKDETQVLRVVDEVLLER
ncbi:ABC transporter ATP-binding protein [Archaeoglobales archaeon]|nr:MAG: ABC transporter ATP-binding protein [Archaeoglobales archaeon]